MKGLTQKEEEIMNFFWLRGALTVKEIQKMYREPRPHVNTISTMVRILEEKGFVDHEAMGKNYRYYPVISKEDFSRGSLKDVIKKYFNDSYLGAVSSLIREEDISLDELRKLIAQVEKAHNK